MPNPSPSDASPESLEPLRVRILVDGRTSIVEAEGDIDFATAHAFQAMSFEAIDPDRERLIVDLSRVTFFDSAGITALVLLHRQAKSSALAIALVCSSTVRKVLEMTGLVSEFELFDSAKAAIS